MLIDNEIDSLNHVWENCNTDMVLNWSSFYAKQKVPNSFPRCETNLLPLVSESSTDLCLVCHAIKLIKKSTKFLNPGQTAVVACDQPIYAVAKQLQWTELFPDISKQHFFVIFCGLHLEQASLRLIGDVLKNSEWSQVVVLADIFTSGVTDNLLAASHIKETRRAHKITFLTLCSRQASDEEEIYQLGNLKSHGSNQF